MEAFDQLTETSLELATIACPQAWLLSLFVFAHMTIFDAPPAAWLSTITFDLPLLTELTRDAHGTLALGGALFRTFWTRGIGTAPIILVIVDRGLLKVLRIGIWTNVCLTGAGRGSQVHGQGCCFVHFLGRLIDRRAVLTRSKSATSGENCQDWHTPIPILSLSSEVRQGTTERSRQRLNLIPPLLYSIADNSTLCRHSLRSEIDRAAGRMKEYCRYKRWDRPSSKVPATNILVSTFASTPSGRAPHASSFLSFQT